MSSLPNLGLERKIINDVPAKQGEIDIPHQLHRRSPNSKQVLLVAHVRPEDLQTSVQGSKNTLLVAISPEVLVCNHLQIAEDVALEHGVVGGTQRRCGRVCHCTGNLVSQHVDVLFELLHVAIFETEQRLPNAEVKHLRNISRVVELEILLEGLPPSGCPRSLNGKGRSLVDRIDSHALNIVEQDICDTCQ